jgi:hypothetical protein
MPILEITDTHVVQQCAICESKFDVAIERLTPSDAGPPIRGGVLALPKCSCGACEFLIHSPVKDPPRSDLGSFEHLHRLAVDALVDAFKERAMGKPSSGNFTDEICGALGADVVAEWFPEGLKIEARNATAAAPANEMTS